MKFFMTAVVAGALLSGIGCHHNLNSCNSCGGGGGGGGVGDAAPAHVGRVPHHYQENLGPAGPPTPSYAYPYYTTRAPRDFLMDNPPSIGP